MVVMSFPKAPLKRFNDPSGAYRGRTWGAGVALTPLAPFDPSVGGQLEAILGLAGGSFNRLIFFFLSF